MGKNNLSEIDDTREWARNRSRNSISFSVHQSRPLESIGIGISNNSKVITHNCPFLASCNGKYLSHGLKQERQQGLGNINPTTEDVGRVRNCAPTCGSQPRDSGVGWISEERLSLDDRRIRIPKPNVNSFIIRIF